MSIKSLKTTVVYNRNKIESNMAVKNLCILKIYLFIEVLANAVLLSNFIT